MVLDGVSPYDRSRPWQERLAFVVDTMREVSRHTDPHEMVAAYSKRMRVLGIGRMLSLSRRGVEPPEFILARDSLWESQPNPWRERGRLPRLRGGLLGELVFANELRYIPDLEVPEDDPAAELLRGWRSLVALPVFDRGEAMNVMIFLRKPPDAFDPEDLPQMFWTTNLFARATHNLVLSDEVKRAYDAVDRELKLIADLQRALLPPELPRIGTLDLAAYYRPAARAGGDYYDFFPQESGRWGFLIADVSGHGSPAAVEMAITRTLAHVRAEGSFSPAELLHYLNHRLGGRLVAAPPFVTAFCGVYDPARRRIRYASAGHPPPRLKRCSDGSLLSLEGTGAPPLGILKPVAFADREQDLVVGDQLVFYTDGITEAMDPRGEMFGIPRLDGVLENCGVTADALIREVLDALTRFTSGRELSDDVTMIVARVVE